ncbi:MAG: hypothetical protein NVS3B3_09310 [Aquirhabdus sp.]
MGNNVVIFNNPEGMYNVMLSHMKTTFYMPPVVHNLDVTYSETLGDLFNSLPFANLRIVEQATFSPKAIASIRDKGDLKTATLMDGSVLTESLLLQREILPTGDSNFVVVSQTKVVGKSGRVHVVYTPVYEEGTNKVQTFMGVMELVFRLVRLLKERRLRYVEREVSRQVRRAEGLAPEHKGYIIIRPDQPVAPNSIVLSKRDILRRVSKLHAVRATYRNEHLRQYKDGKIVVVSGAKVREHVRGSGTHLQPKDYIIK